MTGDTRLERKVGRGANGPKSNALRAVLMLTSLLASVLLVAAPASTQVSRGSNAPKIEVVEGRQAVANEVLVKFHASGNIAQAAQDADN